MKISVQFGVAELTQAVRAQIAGAVAKTAEQGAALWRESVNQASGIWMVEKNDYINSIQTRMDGDFAAEVSTDYRLAGEIENGRPHRDLKRALHTSKRTRMVTKGRHVGQKYLIIPFRHNTPSYTAHARAMPPFIYADAKNLQASSVIGGGARLSATGHLVKQQRYQWGGRLPPGLAPKLKAHHSTDIYAGMVRFNTSAGKGKSSAYLTFRLMGEWQSNKWIVPAKPGLHLAQKTADALAPLLSAAVDNALRR